MKTYWEENLHEFNDFGFYNRLMEISKVFNRLVEPRQYQRARLYYIAQDDFKFLKVGISTNPHKRLLSIQTGNPRQLILLFFRDAERERKDLSFSFGNVKLREWNNIQTEERHVISWISGSRNLDEDKESVKGEWIKMDDRAKRILVREGRILIENLCDELNLNYSEI